MATRRLFDGAQAELGILPIVGASGGIEGRDVTFAGTSTFSATFGTLVSVDATFAGTSTFSVTVGSGSVEGRDATFAGTSTLSATTGTLVSVDATFAGTSTLSATVGSSSVEGRDATFAGTSTLSATPTAVAARAVTFAGTSTLSVTSTAVAARAVTFAGTSTLSASTGTLVGVNATFAGTSTFSATFGTLVSVDATFAGTSTFTATASAPAGIAATFAGTSTFSAVSGSFTRPIGGPVGSLFTPQNIISTVRNVVQDTAAPYRYSDVEMLSCVNMALKMLGTYRPDVFSFTTVTPTTADTIVQTLPSDAIRLVEVFSVYGGNAVTEVNRETLDQMYPGWVSDPAGTPVNFVRHPRNPTSYFLYPRPLEGTMVAVEYIRAPIDYDINDIIDITPDMFAVAVSATIHMLESVDTEPNNAERTKLFRDLALDAMTASLNNRAVPDTETAAVKKLR